MNTLNLENALNGINQSLIERAKSEIFAKEISKKNGFYYEDGVINGKKASEFFISSYREDLSFYRMPKKSGYSVCLLFKETFLVSCQDFQCSDAKEIMANFPEVKEWYVYQEHSLSVKVLKNIFGNPFDARTQNEFKPSALKTWEVLKKFLML